MNIYFPDALLVIGIVCSGYSSACHSVREGACLHIRCVYSRAGHVITCCSARNLKKM